MPCRFTPLPFCRPSAQFRVDIPVEEAEMTSSFRGTYVTTTVAFVISTIAAAPALAQSAAAPTPVEVRGGTASFDVGTNVPALAVHGKSTSLQGRVRVRRGPDGPVLEQIDAAVPVKTLGTGLGLRDQHMRKYIFTTEDGSTPDVRFVADKATCSKVAANQSTCQVAGDLVIRGTSRPFAIALKVTEDGDSYHASGDSVVKLSTYGIAQPSQLGVKTSDEVKLRLDFTGRPAVATAVATTGVVK
jgi:polyisoprenoid-binding protein YceI